MEKAGHEVYQVHLHMHSLKLRSSSSEPSGPTSYGIGRIKSHQVRVMSPVLLIRVSRDVSRVPTIVHASPRKNHREVVCVRAIPRKDPAGPQSLSAVRPQSLSAEATYNHLARQNRNHESTKA